MIAAPTEKPDFAKTDGLIPVIVQDLHTLRVLMLGYMNEEAYTETLTTGRATFFSRSKGRLWTKGETSGHYLLVQSVQLDCDQDTLLIKAIPQGPTCHNGTDTCWAEENPVNALFLEQMEATLVDRKLNPKPGSHTSEMFARGINKIAQKMGEEAVELVIEAKDDNRDLFLNEAADLLYRFTCLIVAKDMRLQDVMEVLQQRHK